MTDHDRDILERIKRNDEQGIDKLFAHHFAPLCMVANRIVQNEDAAKDIVQDVFVKLWTERENVQVKSSLRGYLKQSVVNAGIDYTRRHYEKKKASFEGSSELPAVSGDAERDLESKEIARWVDRAVARLPERCRLVFVLSRHEGLSYKEIAEKLEISPKTVENQMSKALKVLRKALKPLLMLVM